MVFNGLGWSRVVSNGLGWSQMVSDGLGCSFSVDLDYHRTPKPISGLGWDWDWIGSPGGRGYRAPYGANNTPIGNLVNDCPGVFHM